MFRFAAILSGSARLPLPTPSRLFTVARIFRAFYNPIVWSFHAHCSHNVIHQNRPFSRLHAPSLSVAGLNMDDTTFSMSSNVIIFIVNLRPSPSTGPPKHFQYGVCGFS
jgi:hypothetical protein